MYVLNFLTPMSVTKLMRQSKHFKIYSNKSSLIRLNREIQNASQICRAPHNFLKQGVADASLGAKGVFLYSQVFTQERFSKLQI